MKKLSLLLIMLILGMQIYAQKINGIITNETGEKLPGVTLKLEGTYLITVSDKEGYFSFNNVSAGNYKIEASYIGYETAKKEVSVSGKDIQVDFMLKVSDIMADEVVITALRADLKTPIAFTNIEKEDIEKKNTGRDIPYLLDMTPSVVVTSDAGTGIGYTSMRIRGTDMTRINVTLDGIPLNDSESHGVWWVNMPDFASSVNNIQIQRGAGTSTNGAAAFGANINFVTNNLNKDAYADVNWTYGSFNTRKATYKAGTGLLGNHFTFDARLSKIHSDGFIDRAKSDLESYFVSGAYVDKKNLLKINVFRGTEETYQAWYGVPKDSLVSGRTYNPYSYEKEVDHYTQKHYQMFYTHTFNKNLNLNIALHHTKGEGYYEQFKDKQKFEKYGLDALLIGNDTINETNLIRRKWLDNNFTGGIYSIKYTNRNLNIVLGGSLNKYDGNHFGRIIWAEYSINMNKGYEWYRNIGSKIDMNEYLKVNYSIFPELNLWADFQFRIIDYKMEGIHDDLRNITQEHKYTFFNPKAGVSFDISNNQISYFSFAVANREPSRTNFRDAAEDEIFVPETLYDFEAGYKLALNKLALNLNLYYMDYKNQLILTGEINNVGAYIMSNVSDSYRAGAELSAGIKLTEFAEWKLNVTYSNNKIENLIVYIDNWDTWEQETETYEKTDISFSPDIITGSELSFDLFKGFNASLMSKFVGKQYIDNTSNEERSLDAYFVNNLRLSHTIQTKKVKEINLFLNVNNLFNEIYETNAWVYRYKTGGNEYVFDGYFPQAGINFLAGINLRF
ncbi:MAG: TonB-dependent receptor [Bacteroidales bacterium]|nr:TonB-dependent receptor [Bacteroidales bacterium]